MQKYIIKQEYLDDYPELTEAGWELDDQFIIDKDGYWTAPPVEGGMHTNSVPSGGDPTLPPKLRPPILP